MRTNDQHVLRMPGKIRHSLDPRHPVARRGDANVVLRAEPDNRKHQVLMISGQTSGEELGQ